MPFPQKKKLAPFFKSSFQKLISKTLTDKFHVDQLIINTVDCFKQFSGSRHLFILIANRCPVGRNSHKTNKRNQLPFFPQPFHFDFCFPQ